jgi:hypothetical protein
MAINKKAQAARTAQLRALVKSLLEKQQKEEPTTQQEGDKPLSPSDFIQREMAEKGKEKKGNSSTDK